MRWLIAALFLGWLAVVVVCTFVLAGRIEDVVLRTLAIAGINALLLFGLAYLVFSGDD